MTKASTRKIIIIMSALTLFLGVFSGLQIYGSFSETTGYNNVIHKEIDNDRYFIYVNNGNTTIKLESTKYDYEKVIVNSDLAYGISYRWSTYSPQKGKLLNLNFNDVIDNRFNKGTQ
jgi:hypothetical protein